MEFRKRSLSVFVLVLLSVSLLGVVSAASVYDDLFGGAGSNVVSDFFSGLGFAKFLMFLLVALVVYGVVEFLPFVGEKGWVGGGISVAIGILSVYYLKSEEVYTAILSYGALGIVITAIVPFVVIAVVSKRAHEKGFGFLGKVLWLAFAVVLGARWFFSSDIGDFGRLVYPIVAILSLVMFFMENWIYMKMFRATMKGEVGEANKIYLGSLTARLENLQEQLISATTTQAKLAVQAKIDAVKDQIRKSGGTV